MTIPGPGIAEAKRELRRSAAAARDGIPADKRDKWSLGACRHAAEWLKASGADTIIAYVSFRSELDTGPLLAWAWEDEIRVLLPRVNQATGGLDLHKVRSWDELKPGAFGILEPGNEPAADPGSAEGVPLPSAIFVPGLAFDARGGRLGYGRGFYDRLSDAWRSREDAARGSRPLWIGLAFGMQIVEWVPMDAHDAYMDMLITEQGILDCRKERE